MHDRTPDAWMHTRPGPYLMIEKLYGVVTITAVEDGCLVEATGRIQHREVASDHGKAVVVAHRLAAQLE